MPIHKIRIKLRAIMTDGRIDGHFRIDKGGITQGIQVV